MKKIRKKLAIRASLNTLALALAALGSLVYANTGRYYDAGVKCIHSIGCVTTWQVITHSYRVGLFWQAFIYCIAVIIIYQVLMLVINFIDSIRKDVIADNARRAELQAIIDRSKRETEAMKAGV